MSGGVALAAANPITDSLNAGLYHEAVIVVSREGIQANELVQRIDVDGVSYGQREYHDADGTSVIDDFFERRSRNARYQMVGQIDDYIPFKLRLAGPGNIVTYGETNADSWRFGMIRNNCQRCSKLLTSELLDAI